VQLEGLTSTRRARGPLYCPRCCWKLGRAESPAIAYLSACGGCQSGLMIRETADGGLAIVVTEGARGARPVFVELEG
jgi:hypothetical protein